MLSSVISLTLSILFMATARLAAAALSKVRPPITAKIKYTVGVTAQVREEER